MRPTAVSRAGEKLPSTLHKLAKLLLDLLQGTRLGVKVWTIPSRKSLARCLLAMYKPQCGHLQRRAAVRVQSGWVGPCCSLGALRGASAPGSGLFHGREARSGRLPLRRRTRLVSSRLACGTIAGVWRGRSAGTAS